ncbi:protein of unknown function [Methanoculleus bourgensis]|uniref:Uncharacterized protein n=1 Tax=Methanoculleus bourgensis TaxID=83986 RepID=A0A0X3BNY0_9EURY|nr:protein of unknown function [Methanoculleus bourgensis]
MSFLIQRSSISPVNRDIALDPSFPVVLTNLLDIVGHICWDNRRLLSLQRILNTSMISK